MRRVTVATHGHCFDGAASAVLFTKLIQSLHPGATELTYWSCGYGPNMKMVPPGWLTGDQNAILDFRYTPTDRLHWFFDHHVTGFGSDDERDKALAGHRDDVDAPHVFYNTAYGSCAKLITDVATERYAVDLSGFSSLTEWADQIDTARFDSAARALDEAEPVLRLAAVVEQHADGPFLNRLVARLLDERLEDVAASPMVEELFSPIRVARETYRKRVEGAGKKMGRVVYIDLSTSPVAVAGKFVAYALFPQCTYSVQLARTKQHYKMSVGYNPWSGNPRRHDIAAICKRYGGGGHPVVGAATFTLSEHAEATAAALSVARELDGEPRPDAVPKSFAGAEAVRAAR